MAPGVPSAAALFVICAFWSQVSGEATFFSEGASKVLSSGSAAALSEDGYHQVAKLKSDEQMHQFISRFLQTEGLEASTSDLNGFVPWYSGTRAVQSLKKLREELFAKPWVRRVFAADPAPIAAQSEAVPLDLKAKPKTKLEKAAHQANKAAASDKKAKRKIESGVVAHSAHSAANLAAAAPAAFAAAGLKKVPSALDVKSNHAANLADWVVTEAKPKAKLGVTARPVHSEAEPAAEETKLDAKPSVVAYSAHSAANVVAVAPAAFAAAELKKVPSALDVKSNHAAGVADWIVTEAKPKAKLGITAHPVHSEANLAAEETKLDAKPGVVAYSAHSAASLAAAAPAGFAAAGLKKVPSALDVKSNHAASLADWIVTEAKPKAKSGVAAHPVHSAANLAAGKPNHVPSVEEVETDNVANLEGWVVVNVHMNSNVTHYAVHSGANAVVTHDVDLPAQGSHAAPLANGSVTSQSAHVLPKTNHSQLAHVVHQSQLVTTKPRARSLSWIAQQSQLSASKITRNMGNKLSKPILVMKDLIKLHAKDRARFFKSIENTSVMLEVLDGSIKVLRGSDVNKFTNLTKELEHKQPQELLSIMESKGVKCKNCTLQEQVDRVIATWDWPALHKHEARRQATISEDAVQEKITSTSKTCKSKCYRGQHAEASWIGQKCKWTNCGGCPECERKGGSEVNVANKKEDSSVQVCKTKCYTGKHADMPWENHKCKFRNCKGCLECDASLDAMRASPTKLAERRATAFVRCASHCYMGSQPWKDKKCKWKNCDGCPECAGEPQGVPHGQHHDHGNSGKSREAKKFQQHVSELAVDKAVKNAGTVVGDVTTPTARNVEEAVQGASDVASSIFSKILGFFGHADKTASQDEHVLMKSAPQTNAKAEEQNTQEVQTATREVTATKSSHDKPMKRNTAHSKLNKVANATSTSDKKGESEKPLKATEAEDPHASKVKTATLPTADKMTNFLAKPRHANKVSKAMLSRESDVKIPDEVEVAKAQKSSGSAQFSEHAETMQTSKLKAQTSFAANAKVAREVYKAPKAKKMEKALQTTESSEAFDTSDDKASLETAVDLQKSRLPISEDRLPGVHSLLKNSTKVVDELDKQISTLKERLTEAESESERAVASKKAEYEGQLQQQHENTTAMKKVNKELRRNVRTLIKDNSELRLTAKELKDAGDRLREKISDLQANLNMAQEYLDATLENTSKDNEKVRVLRELDEQDALHAKSEEHASALKQVGSVALLQFSSQAESSDPLEVVRILAGRFDDLDREEVASLVALKTHFEEQFNREAQKQDALKKANDELKRREDGQLELREKLQAAVKHLKNSRSFLQEQIKGLQAYALKLAA